MSPYFEFKRNTALNKEGNSNKFACWSNKRVHRELGFNNTRSLGTADSSGFSVATSGSANSGNSSTTVAAVPRTAGLGINRGTGNDRKKGYKWGATRSKGFCLPDFSSPQKRWRSQTGSELEGSKQVHCRGALQDGGISHGERSCETRGLVGEIGSKRCLLSGTSRPQSPEVSSVPVAGQSIPVSLSAIRPILCPSYVYKVDETSGGFSEGEGNQTDHISGRLTNTLQLPGHVAQPTRTDQGFVSDIGPPHQQQEVPVRAITGDCVSGPNNFDHCNASVTTQGESDSDPTRGPANAFQNRGVSTEISSLCGHDNGSETGSPGGSTVSSPLTSSDKQSSPPGIIPRGSETELSSDSRNFEGGLTGIRLVDARNAELQQGSFACGSTRSSDRVRCISLGLGSNPERSGAEDRWSVVNQRTRDAHQLFRATSGIPGNSDFCQGEAEYQYFSEDRQCVNQGIHKSLWRDPLMANESLSHTDMEVVYRSENIPNSRAPSRDNESSSRQGVKDSERPLRLDDPSTSICTDREEDGTSRSGHVCIPSNTSASTLLQLEARSSGRGNRCFQSGLESVSGICKPSMVSTLAYAGEDSTGEGQSSFGSTNVEDTTMVSSASPTAEGNSTPDPNTRECCDFTNAGGVHNAIRSTTVGRLAIIRHQGRSGGLSEGASRLLESSWRDKTKSTYESLFKRWDSWCMERNRDPIRGPIADVLNFLAELFEQGYQYRSLNSYRSAISSVHEKVDGVEVGKHPLVARMLKGAFNERPPRPKYESIWQVDLVLTMFKKDGPSSTLSLQDLTVKTAMLLALTRPCRGADLAELDLSNRSYIPEGVVFHPHHLSKQSRPSHHSVSFFFPKFEEDKCLCPVETLKAYEERTSSFRKDPQENQVFRSFIGKHGPVTSSTIARWLKSCLHKAGVDTSKFKAHSTRAAAATKAAMSGVTVEDIMKAADWSNEGVFQKFYYRPQHSVEFGSSVLAASASKSHVDMETEPSEV